MFFRFSSENSSVLIQNSLAMKLEHNRNHYNGSDELELELELIQTHMRAVLVPSTNFQLLNFLAIEGSWLVEIFRNSSRTSQNTIAGNRRTKIAATSSSPTQRWRRSESQVFPSIRQSVLSQNFDWLNFDDVFSELLILFWFRGYSKKPWRTIRDGVSPWPSLSSVFFFLVHLAKINMEPAAILPYSWLNCSTKI